MTPAAVTFWKHYIVQNRTSARLLRTGLCMALMLAFEPARRRTPFGDPPLAPQRGDWSEWMEALTTTPPALAVQFLIFFVVDATLLCVFFVRGLRLHHANWPERTLQTFHARTGVPVEYLDDWIDLQFIARRTRAIGTLIYYPFIVLSLMLVARSSFFDDWYTPPTVLAVATLSFGIVLRLRLRVAAHCRGFAAACRRPPARRHPACQGGWQWRAGRPTRNPARPQRAAKRWRLRTLFAAALAEGRAAARAELWRLVAVRLPVDAQPLKRPLRPCPGL
ncbi:MAG: hypothetical protein MZW92_23335 [Comamonadaceae bacterium]|nr:hypothetical protein [Comamonadaceae bacterium]